MKTCSCYQYHPLREKTPVCCYRPAHTSHGLGGIAYVYRLEGHELRFALHRCQLAYDDSTFQAGIDDWCTPAFSTWLSTTKTQSPTPSPGPLGTILGISWLQAKRTFSTSLWHSKSLSAGPVGLHAWIWLLRYAAKGSVTLPTILIVTFFICRY